MPEREALEEFRQKQEETEPKSIIGSLRRKTSK
jgi:hypothetical protein